MMARNRLSGRIHKVAARADPDRDPIDHAFGLLHTTCGRLLFLHKHDTDVEACSLVTRYEVEELCTACRRRMAADGH